MATASCSLVRRGLGAASRRAWPRGSWSPEGPTIPLDSWRQRAEQRPPSPPNGRRARCSAAGSGARETETRPGPPPRALDPAMLNKVSTGNSMLDVLMCMVLPLILRQVMPYLYDLYQRLTKAGTPVLL